MAHPVKDQILHGRPTEVPVTWAGKMPGKIDGREGEGSWIDPRDQSSGGTVPLIVCRDYTQHVVAVGEVRGEVAEIRAVGNDVIVGQGGTAAKGIGDDQARRRSGVQELPHIPGTKSSDSQVMVDLVHVRQVGMVIRNGPQGGKIPPAHVAHGGSLSICATIACRFATLPGLGMCTSTIGTSLIRKVILPSRALSRAFTSPTVVSSTNSTSSSVKAISRPEVSNPISFSGMPAIAL